VGNVFARPPAVAARLKKKTKMPDPSAAARLAEAAAWCKQQVDKLSTDINRFVGPLATIPVSTFGAICQQARAYAVALRAARLIPELGATTIEGEASIADALRQVQLLAEWVEAAVDRTEGGNAGRPTEPAADVFHSADFRSARWYGTDYVFTATQAACVRVLWEAWKSGAPAVGQSFVLEAADSTGSRLRDVFRKGKHPTGGR